MFTTDIDPRGFARITVNGKIDADAMKTGLEAFLSALKDDRKTDFLYMIDDFEVPSLDALAVEFRFLPTLFAALPKIGKVAVVSSQGWLRTAAEVEGKLIPGLTIETFAPAQMDDAITWLNGPS